MKALRGAWLAWSERHVTLDLGVEFEPHSGCRDYFNKQFKKNFVLNEGFEKFRKMKTSYKCQKCIKFKVQMTFLTKEKGSGHLGGIVG